METRTHAVEAGNEKRESKSLFIMEMNGERYYCENTSGLDAEGLIAAYAACEKPFVEMLQYGKQISGEDYAYIEQGDALTSTIYFDFSIEFNADQDEITIFSQQDRGSEHLKHEIKGLQEAVAEKRSNSRQSVLENLHQKQNEIKRVQKGDEQRTLERLDRGMDR